MLVKLWLWSQYELAGNEMVERTSTEYVSAEDKHRGRLEVIRTVTEAIEREVDG